MNIMLRNVNKKNDLELILSWRSNPDIYKWFKIQDGPLKWKDHLEYWERRDINSDFLILVDNRRVGLISINDLGKVSEISIMIGEVSLWGQGIAKKALNIFLTKNMNHETKIIANVRFDNTGSRKLFESVGFELMVNFQDHEGWLRYTYEIGGGQNDTI